MVNSSSIPQCVKSSCKYGEVQYNGTCYPLNRGEACTDYKKMIGREVFLVAHPAKPELTCADDDFFYECRGMCCIGSKRGHKDICIKNTKRGVIKGRITPEVFSAQTGL